MVVSAVVIVEQRGSRKTEPRTVEKAIVFMPDTIERAYMLEGNGLSRIIRHRLCSMVLGLCLADINFS